jgi:DNA-binding Xre family transcriptional regulator
MENTQYLDKIIVSSGKKKGYLADRLGMTRQTFSKKIQDPSSFTNLQTNILCEELNITLLSERQKIFCSKC